MFRSIWRLSIHAHDFFQHYMQSNRLLAATRTRRALKWGIPAMLVSVPYLAIANLCTILIDRGTPEWLHLVVLWGHLERSQVRSQWSCRPVPSRASGHA